MKSDEELTATIIKLRERKIPYDLIAERINVGEVKCKLLAKRHYCRAAYYRRLAAMTKEERREYRDKRNAVNRHKTNILKSNHCDVHKPITDAEARRRRAAIVDTRDITGFLFGDPLPHQQQWRATQ